MKIVINRDLIDIKKFKKPPHFQIQVKELIVSALKPSNLNFLDKLLKEFVLPLKSLSIQFFGFKE